jgi:hypothetical protein
MFVLLGVYAAAQQEAKVIAEIAASSEKAIKNSPFSAEAVSESIQVLADGNRIVRSSTSKMYRNSEGRFRREMAGGSGGYPGSFYTYGQGISILDPVVGYRYMLDSYLKTARVYALKAGQGFTITGTAKGPGHKIVSREDLTDAQKAGLDARIAAEKNLAEAQKALAVEKAAAAKSAVAVARATAPLIELSGQGLAVAGTINGSGESGMFTYHPGGHEKFETKTEELGTRDFEGVSAEGIRKVTTIPAGAIGNERPIEITYERWYSKELDLVVYSKHSDPRFGDQTYRLTNIVRSEPDPSLFTVPTGYKMKYEPHPVYKLSTTLKNTVVASPATQKPSVTTSVKNTKP